MLDERNFAGAHAGRLNSIIGSIQDIQAIAELRQGQCTARKALQRLVAK